MALGGGTFTAQNKILPGAYINFVSLSHASAALSERGVAAMPLILDWGPEGEVFTVEASQIQKDALKRFGYPYSHSKLRGIRDLFRNIRTGYLYRLNSGGTKASCAYAEAKCSGSRGNDIRLIITENAGRYLVRTLLGETETDAQLVTSPSQLKPNDFVTFRMDALEATAGINLTGGTDGNAADADAYQEFLNRIEPYSFNTLGCPSTDDSVKSLFVDFTKRMRDDAGVKFQTVGYRMTADYEGIISVENRVLSAIPSAGSLRAGESAAGGEPEYGLVYWVTGAEAGCAVNRSITNRKYDGEYSVDTGYTQTQLEDALTGGKLVFHGTAGEVRVLEDVNTFTSFTEEKGADFSSNQTVRVLDQIANDIAVLFRQKYYGQVTNDSAGRISLWNDIVRHHQELQAIRALENFLPDDVSVEQGETKKSVSVTDRVTPANAMSQLYITVIVA